MKKTLTGALALLTGAALLIGAAPAMAQVTVDVHIGSPGPVYSHPYPVYAPPRPVYVTPQPIYVTPQPVYVRAPQRVYYQGPPGHWKKKSKHPHYRKHHHKKDRYHYRY